MNILKKIIEQKKIEVEVHKQENNLSLDALKADCLKMPPVKSFIKILENKRLKNEVALISEVKKASPSKGLIRPDFEPVKIAQAYEEAGASAISVLTDEKFFQGSIEYLKNIKEAVKLPVLRKDFIIDTFQIYQTRLMGADLMLLIVAALEKQQVQQYYKLACEIGLEVLVEVHTEEEFDFARKLGCKLIGINNRNLETFETSLFNTLSIINNRPFNNIFIVSESGINDNEDIITLKENGISAVLVGESLMRQDNIEQAVKKLLIGQSEDNETFISNIDTDKFNPFGASPEELIANAVEEAGLIQEATIINRSNARDLYVSYCSKRENYKEITKIGNILIKRQVITIEELNKALEYQKANPDIKIGNVLLELKLCSEQDILNSINAQAQAREDIKELSKMQEEIAIIKERLYKTL